MFARLCVCVVLLCSGAVSAHEFSVGKIRIIHPWARATAPGAAAGGGFMVLENAGAADRLVSAQAGVSAVVELHTMSMEGNVMRMRKLEQGIELPAGGRVALKPGGLHVMFIELKAPLKEGESFPLTLQFEKAGEVSVSVEVMGMGAGGVSKMAPAH